MRDSERRVFAFDGEWWLAQAHVEGGTGWGAARAFANDIVYFTPLSDEPRNSLCARVKAGQLNRLSHDEIIALLKSAEDTETRLHIGRVDLPITTTAGDEIRFKDDKGLHWAFQQRKLPKFKEGEFVGNLPAVEVICLDDSAIRRIVTLGDSAAEGESHLTKESVSRYGPALIRAVEETFAA